MVSTLVSHFGGQSLRSVGFREEERGKAEAGREGGREGGRKGGTADLSRQ